MLQASHYWMADGTYQNTPSLSVQVYVVHGLRGEAADLTKTGHLLPSIFVLLLNKTEATYSIEECGSRYSYAVPLFSPFTCC